MKHAVPPIIPRQWRRCQKGTREACNSTHYTATMEEMPERHTWAGQIMVSLHILCVSIDLKVYFLCPVIIQFHPLPPQWRRCEKGTREASSSSHYRHNGGDARKAHVKHAVPPIIPQQWRRCQKGTRWPVKL